MRRRDRGVLGEIREIVAGLGQRLEVIQTVLMVREPESVTAASAYEGLRKQVVAVAQERWSHVTQLAQMDSALHHTDDVASLRRVSSEWLEQAGVTKVRDPSAIDRPEDAFELVQTGRHGTRFEVLRPAYVDSATGRVLKRGQAQLVENSKSPPDLASDERLPAADGEDS